MTTGRQHPIRGEGNRAKELQVNDVVTHPLASSESGPSRDRLKYRYLRTTRLPTPDRPNSGRILVENVATGKRTEHYAILFGIGFRNA